MFSHKRLYSGKKVTTYNYTVKKGCIGVPVGVKRGRVGAIRSRIDAGLTRI